MAGYTRQSNATIINGANITAPPLNAEFNQISAAFNSSSGHSHDGTSGNSPKINLTTSVSGYLPAVHGGIGGKNKLDATTTPAVSNDNTEGYAPGSLWENTNTGRVYICVGNSTGAAVWRELVQVNSGTAILPAATDTVDLGNNSTRFQDLFLSGGISASGNVAVGGTMNITGATALGSTLGVTGDTTLVNLSATGTTTITSIDLNSGAIDSTTIGTTTPAAGTFTTLNANTSLVAATADINGGTVDGATIGASTPSTGAFTTISTSGQATLASADINGGNIDGTAIGASTASTGAFTSLLANVSLSAASADINGGTIDATTIGATTASTGAFTTVTASGGITGALTGNVTGNVTGSLSGGTVTGNVTGDLTGNVTSSGSSSFNNVTIDGTLNMNAGTSATIQNLTAPTNDLDAATKKYVDDEISTLIGDAGAGLNTLGELADALNDDDDFSTTVTNSIATKLPKAGGTMTGAIAMSTNKITGVGDPTSAQDVATKVYTDTQRDTRVAKTGDTMSGALAMGSNKITGLGTPTAGTDATTKTYVDGILGSSTAAATSASNAATSESNAATSETNASNSATAAAGSATSAAASYDSFDDRYLGAKSSAPTVDNDGDALIVGALYFNTTTNIMNVYGSGGWQSAGSAVNGTSDRQTYTATAGQTVFAATYDAGYVDVYLNGVKQLIGTDVTATNGTSVVFASGTTVNDIVDIVAYGTFVLADHLTETQSDAKYVEVAGDTMTGNLNITGTLISDGLTLGDNSTSEIPIYFNSSSTDFSIGANGNNFILAQTTGDLDTNQLLTVTNSGNVGIGVIPEPSWDTFTALQIEGSSLGGLGDNNTILGSNIYHDNNAFKYIGSAAATVYQQRLGEHRWSGAASGTAGNTANMTQHMTLDASGNLLVGTPSLGNADVGVEARANGTLTTTTDSQTALFVKRIGSGSNDDGELARFQNADGTVGSIGAKNSVLLIGSGATGLMFESGGNDIIPRNTDGNNSNGATNLGSNTSRFNDLHLSGSIEIENGTRNIGVGKEALNSNTGNRNTALGYRAGYANSSGYRNVYIGELAGNTNQTGNENVYIGRYAGSSSTGSHNTFIGEESGVSQSSGTFNNYLGTYSGSAMQTGSKNTIVGKFSGNQGGLDIRTSSNNIVLSDGDGDPLMYYHGGLTSPMWFIRNATSGQWNTRFNCEHNSGPYGVHIRYPNASPNSGSNFFLYAQDSTSVRFFVASNGDVRNVNNSYGATSDLKLKENISDAASQWDDIKAIQVKKYSMKLDALDAPNKLGVIAQDLEASGMSGLVSETVDVDPDGTILETTTKTVKYSILYMKAVKALQEAMDRIETLEAKVTALETP